MISSPRSERYSIIYVVVLCLHKRSSLQIQILVVALEYIVSFTIHSTYIERVARVEREETVQSTCWFNDVCQNQIVKAQDPSKQQASPQWGVNFDKCRRQILMDGPKLLTLYLKQREVRSYFAEKKMKKNFIILPTQDLDVSEQEKASDDFLS